MTPKVFHGRGEAAPRAKLTEQDVKQIRQLKGAVSQRNLAVQFGVSKSAVKLCQQGKTWAGVL